jgi:hypothetical protein
MDLTDISETETNEQPSFMEMKSQLEEDVAKLQAKVSALSAQKEAATRPSSSTPRPNLPSFGIPGNGNDTMSIDQVGQLFMNLESQMGERIQMHISAAVVPLQQQILELEKQKAYNSSSKSQKGDDRRATLKIANDDEFPMDKIPKSLRDPKPTVHFSGAQSENIDQFLRQLQQSIRLAPRQLWGLYLSNALQGQALIAFEQHFTSLNEVSWENGIKFLRQRYRKPTFQHDFLRSALSATHSASAAAFFQYFSTQLALADSGHIPDSLLIAMTSVHLKADVYKELRKDPAKLTEKYTFEQFKADAIAQDQAIHNSKGVRHNDTAAVIDVERPTPSDRETFSQYEAFVTAEKAGSDVRRPAYQFPTDYKYDKFCRYCKSRDHLAPCCDKLYKRLNSVDIPESLIQKNEAAMK